MTYSASAPAPAGPLYAITLTPPWGGCIAHLWKDVENRTWRPESAGFPLGSLLVIHSGRLPKLVGNSHAAVELREDLAWIIHTPTLFSPQQRLQLQEQRLTIQSLLQSGLVAICRVKNITRTSASPWAAPGQYHWHLTEVLTLPKPIPYTGHQRLWKLDETTSHSLREQHAAAYPVKSNPLSKPARNWGNPPWSDL